MKWQWAPTPLGFGWPEKLTFHFKARVQTIDTGPITLVYSKPLAANCLIAWPPNFAGDLNEANPHFRA
jgi:hypothetical protein